MDEIQGLLFSGGQVVGDDGKKIGALGEVFLDARSGDPAWVTVKTGLFGNAETFVPLVGGSVRDGEVHVPYGKDQVKHAPRVESRGGHLTPAEERDLYRHYGLLHDDEAGHDAGDDVRDDAGHDAARGAATDRVDAGPAAPADPEPVATTAAAAAAPATAPSPAPVPAPAPAPVDDGSMVRSEERLRVVGTERVPTERVRMRRYTVTENKTVTVPVSREEFRLEYEPEAPGATGEVVELGDDASAGGTGQHVAPGTPRDDVVGRAPGARHDGTDDGTDEGTGHGAGEHRA